MGIFSRKPPAPGCSAMTSTTVGRHWRNTAQAGTASAILGLDGGGVLTNRVAHTSDTSFFGAWPMETPAVPSDARDSPAPSAPRSTTAFTSCPRQDRRSRTCPASDSGRTALSAATKSRPVTFTSSDDRGQAPDLRAARHHALRRGQQDRRPSTPPVSDLPLPPRRRARDHPAPTRIANATPSPTPAGRGARDPGVLPIRRLSVPSRAESRRERSLQLGHIQPDSDANPGPNRPGGADATPRRSLSGRQGPEATLVTPTRRRQRDRMSIDL